MYNKNEEMEKENQAQEAKTRNMETRKRISSSASETYLLVHSQLTVPTEDYPRGPSSVLRSFGTDSVPLAADEWSPAPEISVEEIEGVMGTGEDDERGLVLGG